MESCGGVLSKLKDLGPELCVYFLDNFLENEKTYLGSFHTIPTTLLRDPQTYTKGLLVLNTFLNYCTPEDLNKAGSSWLTPLMRHICLDMHTTCSVDLSYSLLGKIITKSSDAKELVKTISSTYLSRLVLNLVDTPKNCHFVALQCLSACLMHYGGHCSPLQGRIEKFILTFVDSQDERITQEAAKCLMLMQQLSGGGVQGVNHNKSWGRLQSRLLGSLSDTLSAIFGDELSSGDNADAETKFLLPEIDLNSGPLKRIVDLIQRFRNLCTFLSLALLGPYKTTKPVQPVKILKVISKTVEILGNASRGSLVLEDVITVNILPAMHESILELLKAVIALLRGNMVLFSRSICSILLSSLKCSARFSSLRIAVYKLFVFWCNTVNASSCVEDISDPFITSIIQDTKPFVVKVHLQVNGMNGKNKPSKRLKRKLGENVDKDESEDENMTERHLNAEKYEELCTEALNCLRQLIRCGSCFMKSHQMKRIYEHTMALMMQNVEIDRKKRPLYANRYCRRGLFLVLKELLVTSFTITLPQSQFLIHVFAQAQNSEHWHDNRILCGEILGDLERVIHPQKLEFKFPPREEIQPLTMSRTNSQENIPLPSSDDEPEKIPETLSITDLSSDKPSHAIEEVIVMDQDTDVKETETTEIHIEEGEGGFERALSVEADEMQKENKEENIPVINEENQKIDEAASTKDIVLEINSDESNEVQELSDEEIVFTPVSNPQVTSTALNSQEPQKKRPRKSLIILDEDSNDDDVTDLVSYFVDDP